MSANQNAVAKMAEHAIQRPDIVSARMVGQEQSVQIDVHLVFGA